MTQPVSSVRESGREPQASVIITSYNYARFLPAAIESALAQTYPDTEVVVVDDGSTDESRQVIARYGDRVTPILKENGGQTSAFNAGFAASRGEIVCFLDSDDVLVPTALEAAAGLLRDTRVAKVHWPLWVIDEQGQPTGEIEPPHPLEGGDLREVAILEGPAAYTTVPTTGNAFPRSFLEQVLPLPEAGHKNAAAGYLKALAPIFGTIAVLEEPQGYYRVHGANLYAGRSLREKTEFLLEHFEPRARLLSRHLREMGVEVDPSAWKAGGRYRKWRSRVGGDEAARQ